ncbi:hypothetical protein AJ88_16690 [Mesorhizobium amorphae CCBAU 01583]|nr:hypothetical protein AJ88_16690 [Mesorhizobium amorphae CCBAU 01583]
MLCIRCWKVAISDASNQDTEPFAHRRDRSHVNNDEIILHGSGDRVTQRPLAFYDAVARAMAQENRP